MNGEKPTHQSQTVNQQPCRGHTDLFEHLREVVDVGRAAVLRLEPLQLEVVLGEVRRVNRQPVQGTLLGAQSLKLHLKEGSMESETGTVMLIFHNHFNDLPASDTEVLFNNLYILLYLAYHTYDSISIKDIAKCEAVTLCIEVKICIAEYNL